MAKQSAYQLPTLFTKTHQLSHIIFKYLLCRHCIYTRMQSRLEWPMCVRAVLHETHRAKGKGGGQKEGEALAVVEEEEGTAKPAPFFILFQPSRRLSTHTHTHPYTLLRARSRVIWLFCSRLREIGYNCAAMQAEWEKQKERRLCFFGFKYNFNALWIVKSIIRLWPKSSERGGGSLSRETLNV